ncbi:MAG: ABC transporter permease [Dehalococcoidia bacterium]
MATIAMRRPAAAAARPKRGAGPRWPRSPQFWAGSAIVAIATAAALLAPLLAPYDPLVQDTYARYAGPSAQHLLGLDELGRDVLSRLLHGARITLRTGITSIAIAMPAGALLGAWAGFRRGWLDAAIMRVLDVQLAYPGILLALVLIVTLGASQRSVIIALAIGYVPYFARIIRGAVMREASLDYVLAAEALGQRRWMMLLRHIGPNVAGLLVVHGSFAVSGAMVAESSLSFLGLGVSPSDPSWGRMLSEGTQAVYIAPHVAVIPIAALSLVILGWFLIGEGSREWLDPRRG